MARWGFDCFAIDLIDGPDAVLAYLCENANLNSVVSPSPPLLLPSPPCSCLDFLSLSQPISLGKNQLNHREIEAANVSRYFTPDGSHSIKRSRYGAQGNLVEMRPLTKAKIMGQGGVFVSLPPSWAAGADLPHPRSPVDQGKLDDLRRQKNEIQPKMEEVGAIFSQASKDEDELRQQIASLEMDRVRRRFSWREPPPPRDRRELTPALPRMCSGSWPRSARL